MPFFRSLFGAKRTETSSQKIDVSKYAESDIITRDVGVIGGGAAGTFAAIQLQQHTKSVVVVEKESRLGGQTMTYIDPESGTPVDSASPGAEDRTRLIRAKRVIFAVPPLPATLKDVDLSDEEKRLFSQFRHTYCYTAIVRTEDLPTDMCYLNRGVGFQHLRLPCVLTVRPSPVDNLRTLHIGSSTPLSDEDIRREIVSSFRSCQLGDPKVLALGNHSPYHLTVSAETIASGFYRELNALQGTRRSFYVGAAFESHNSPPIWALVNQLLRNDILPSLKKG
ncbi:hypothetical protein BJX96DRAFT_179602 [Aspergillus floccosus]